VSALDGYRVIDLTAYVAGPFAGQLLGDLGADVIKLEPPGGDETRYRGRSSSGAMAPTFANLNRNKRSVVLDLKDDDDRRRLLDLVATADVFLHNLRLDTVERLGVGYDHLREVRPDLVYCRITGFGSDGPYAGRPAFDDVVQGASGFAALQGRRGGRGEGQVPEYTAFPMMDEVAGMFATQSILAALLHRERTGRGQLVEVPMLEAGVAFILPNNLWDRTWDPAGAVGYPRNLAPHRRPFRTLDGWFCTVLATDHHYHRFFEACGRAELNDDPRFGTVRGRSLDSALVHQTLGEIFATGTTAHWCELADRLGLPGLPLNEPEDLFDDPHLRAVGFFPTIDHPTEGPMTTLAPPVRFSDSPSSIRYPPPGLGQHNDEVLGAEEDRRP
jgi:formyl-CoA transferase